MRMGSFARDLLISTFSVVLLCVGSIMVAFSSNISTLVVGFCITTLGSGATVSLRAFLASKVDTSLSGRIFAAISATSAIGSLVGMPLMGTLYSLSISKEASSISLPFVVAAVSFPNLAWNPNLDSVLGGLFSCFICYWLGTIFNLD